MSRTDLIEARVVKLITGFRDDVQTYDDSVLSTGQQLAFHRKTIALRQQAAASGSWRGRAVRRKSSAHAPGLEYRAPCFALGARRGIDCRAARRRAAPRATRIADD